MEKEFNSKYLLNDVLRNINQDIVTLRQDFKRLNELVIVLSVKIDETKSIKTELAIVLSKIDSITNKIFDLEKAKDKIELLLSQIEKDNKSADAIAALESNNKIKDLDTKITGISKFIPWLKKILIAIVLSIGIIVYITESSSKFADVCLYIIGKIFSF